MIWIYSIFFFFQCFAEDQQYSNCYENTFLEIEYNENIYLQIENFCSTFTLSTDMCSSVHEKISSLFKINGIHIPIQMVSISNETTFSASIGRLVMHL